MDIRVIIADLLRERDGLGTGYLAAHCGETSKDIALILDNEPTIFKYENKKWSLVNPNKIATFTPNPSLLRSYHFFDEYEMCTDPIEPLTEI